MNAEASNLPRSSTRSSFCFALWTPLLWWLAGLSWGGFALGWIAFAPLFFALSTLPARARWKLGYFIGWLGFALVNWWIVPTIARGGPVLGLPVFLGALLGIVAVALIALIHGFGVAIIALLWDANHPLARRFSWLLPIVAALLWACFDAMRGLTPLAHMWGAPAYTQWRDTAFLQSAAWIGQHGLSALCVWFSASFALWAARRDGAAQPILWCAPALVFALLHILGAWRLYQDPAPSRSLRVLLVGTAIPALRKNQGLGETPLQQSLRLTREYFAEREHSPTKQYSGAPIDLIVWPESTLEFRRFGLERAPSGLDWEQISALSRELKTPILFGGLSRSAGENGEELFNEATLVSPNGKSNASAKNRLVPFGERAVGGDIWPFLKGLAPDPPLARAPGIRALTLEKNGEKLTLGSVICFESCFPWPATQLRKEGAQAIFVLTNDSWFDGTEAPWQHAAMAAVRAVENGVPVAQAANGGYVVAIDAKGRFTAVGDFSRPQAVAVTLELQ